MGEQGRRVGAALVAAALLWHFLAVLSPAWVLVARDQTGRDFASYFYALDVTDHGGDPYAKQELGKTAKDDRPGRGGGVHPFLYPPPFLLSIAWASPMSLGAAYRTWFWLNEVAALAAGAALWRWWRGLSVGLVGPAVALAMALCTALPNNLAMGQANLFPLALTIGGLWADARRKPEVAGALVGAACMLKMSPALFVILWLAQRNWRAAGAAVATAVVLSLAAIPVVGVGSQLTFYLHVLPTFSSGAYNGLSVPIDLFGNHSIPNLFDQAFSAGEGVLSPTARALSGVFALALVGGLSFAFRKPPADELQRALQVGAIAIAMLLVPVYTYEHHLVWGIPAAVAAVLAVARGRLPWGWAIPVGLAVGVWAFDLDILREISRHSVVPGVAQEAKCVALIALLVACVAGALRPPEPEPA